MAFMEHAGRFMVRFRYLIVAIWVIAGATTIVALPQLSSVTNSDNSSFLPSTAPSQQAATLASPFQPKGGSVATLVAMSDNGALTAADEAAITQMEAEIARQAHVTTVRDQGISRDEQARKAQITVDITQASSIAGSVVANIRSAVASVSAPPDLSVHVTGQLATNVDNQVASQKASQLTERLSNLVILLLLILVFRSALAPLITLAAPVLTLLMAEHLVAGAATLGIGGIQASNVTQTILTVLLLGAGADYGLFLILRYREELGQGRETHDALVAAYARVGESITFSAGTVIAALLCLALATFGVYRGLGPSLALSIALMLLAALTLLPALLAIFGRAVFWPTPPSTGRQRQGLWGRIAGPVVRRPAITLVIGVALFGALGVAALGYAPAEFAGSTSGPTGSDSTAGQNAIAAHYPIAVTKPTTALFTFPSSVWSDLTPVQQTERELSASSAFSSVNGPLDPNGVSVSPAQLETLYARLGAPSLLPPVEPAALMSVLHATVYNAYRAEAQFISADGMTVQFYTTLATGDPSSAAALQAMPTVRNDVATIGRDVGATASGVYGQAAIASDVSAVSDADLARIVPIVLALIAALLAIVMRSLIAPLYLVASVALSYAATLGAAVLIFMRAQGQTGLNFVLPFLMFIFLMALGEDYNILVMSRIREEATHMPLRAAIGKALDATGGTVTSAGLILAGTFSVAGIFGATEQVRQLGIAIALGVLLDTFVVRTLLVPSVVALLGRWNWWPSALWRATLQPETASTREAITSHTEH